jgi:hypothetical protein
MKRPLTAPPSGSTEGWQAIGPICGIPSAAVGGATSDKVPTAAPRLLHIFRRHAHNVLQAAALATGSVPAQSR